MKVYKRVKGHNETILTVYGSNREIRIDHTMPRKGDSRAFFRYRNRRYYLDEFERIHNNPWRSKPVDYMKEFYGVKSESFSSGVLVKLGCSGESVMAYYYAS